MKKFKKVLEQLQNCSNIEEFIEQRKNECIEENKESKQNPRLLGRAIGLNRMGNMRMGGVISASSDFIVENRVVKIEQGLLDHVSITTGNLDETYLNLLSRLKREDPNSLNVDNIAKMVYQIVNEYFGPKGDVNRTDNLIEEDFGINTLSMLKGKNKAACVERALLSQNLFKILGIDSTIKQSSITNNGKEEGHAYNIIRIDGKNYIYDSALPKLNLHGEKETIVGTISDEEYMLIIDGLQKNGCKTQKMDNGIVYDSSFGTLTEELQTRSPEELQSFRKQAKLDKKEISATSVGEGTLSEQALTAEKIETSSTIFQHLKLQKKEQTKGEK